MNSKRAIVLLSGGLDSAVTLHIARKEGYKAHCLIFDYGQRHRKEIEAAKKIAGAANCPHEIIKLRFPWKGSALLDKSLVIPKPANPSAALGTNRLIPRLRSGGAGQPASIPLTYVPARNLIFLTSALSFAETIGARAIYIGAHAQDYSGYPDCRPEFYRAFRRVVSCGTKAGVEQKKIEIKTPLINKSKAQIIRAGVKLRVPFELTWSCYRGGLRPCDNCDSCFYRAKGFQEAGIKDPLL